MESYGYMCVVDKMQEKKKKKKRKRKRKRKCMDERKAKN